MNSLEQATKAIFDELHNDGCPFEDSERLAIIAKHMDAFAREQNRELLKDKERLDFAETHNIKYNPDKLSFREALDEAIALDKAALAKGDV